MQRPGGDSAEREDSLHSETSETSGGEHGFDDSSESTAETKSHSWTGRSASTTHYEKHRELFNMDKFGVVEVVDRPQSQEVLSTRLCTKTDVWTDLTKCGLWQEDLSKLSVSDAGFYAGAAKLTTLWRSSNHLAATSQKSSCFRRLPQCVSSITNAERTRTCVCRGSA